MLTANLGLLTSTVPCADRHSCELTPSGAKQALWVFVYSVVSSTLPSLKAPSVLRLSWWGGEVHLGTSGTQLSFALLLPPLDKRLLSVNKQKPQILSPRSGILVARAHLSIIPVIRSGF